MASQQQKIGYHAVAPYEHDYDRTMVSRDWAIVRRHVLLLLLNFITDPLLHTRAGKYDSCPNYKHYIKTLHY